ncbi:hypothetical protein CEK26_002863 [Fusarium fujikuroi]|nr:hypothetical protein CEK26_002863 [Fusarium fujikuroi]
MAMRYLMVLDKDIWNSRYRVRVAQNQDTQVYCTGRIYYDEKHNSYTDFSKAKAKLQLSTIVNFEKTRIQGSGQQITKGGQQKQKKHKKKVSGTVADQGKNPMPKKSLKSGTSSNKQQLVKTAVISKKQNVETGIKKKSKKKKRKEQKLAIEQAQAQPNAKQGQKKLATMAKAKGSKTGAKVKATTKSVIKNGK